MTEKSSNGNGASIPDPEVLAKATRRTFTARYKLSILEQAETCKTEGELGQLLRREGLYSSYLTTWRRQREAGALRELGQRRGRKPKLVDKEKEQLKRENERLRRELAQAEQIIEIQKKVAALLGNPITDDELNGSM